MKKILLVEDDDTLRKTLAYNLSQEGYKVLQSGDGAEALDLARGHSPDLIVLDVMLPSLDGLSVCRILRNESDVPIIMLTARSGEVDRIVGLEIGADDYIVKPFSFRELLARISANLRRMALLSQAETATPNDERDHIGAITIDRRRHRVWRGEALVNLTQREYDLLIALRTANGAVVPRSDLLDQVWGEGWIGDPRTLDVHIRWLREKLEADPSAPQLILTVRGVGYRLVTPDELR